MCGIVGKIKLISHELHVSCLLCPPHGAVHGARTSCTRKGHRETYSALRSMMFGARLPAPEKEKEYMRESGEKKYGMKNVVFSYFVAILANVDINLRLQIYKIAI